LGKHHKNSVQFFLTKFLDIFFKISKIFVENDVNFSLSDQALLETYQVFRVWPLKLAFKNIIVKPLPQNFPKCTMLVHFVVHVQYRYEIRKSLHLKMGIVAKVGFERARIWIFSKARK